MDTCDDRRWMRLDVRSVPSVGSGGVGVCGFQVWFRLRFFDAKSIIPFHSIHTVLCYKRLSADKKLYVYITRRRQSRSDDQASVSARAISAATTTRATKSPKIARALSSSAATSPR